MYECDMFIIKSVPHLQKYDKKYNSYRVHSKFCALFHVKNVFIL